MGKELGIEGYWVCSKGAFCGPSPKQGELCPVGCAVGVILSDQPSPNGQLTLFS